MRSACDSSSRVMISYDFERALPAACEVREHVAKGLACSRLLALDKATADFILILPNWERSASS